MNIYFLSGLGADSRAFKYLQLPPEYNLIFIDWLVPQKKESLAQYAQRIAAGINTKEPFILVGLSFGGILATEVMQFVKPQQTILLSSVAARRELPLLYRLAGRCRLNRLIPPGMGNKANFLTYWLFGVNRVKEKSLLTEILTYHNTAFSKWAVQEILNWKRKEIPPGIIRIHGTRDRVLPARRFKPDHIIKNGGHLMVANRAAEVSQLLLLAITSLAARRQVHGPGLPA